MKETIVFLHGLGSTGYLFDEVKNFLGEVETVALDLPGHGETVMLENMTIDSLCSWLNDKIVNPSIIAGHSLGAVISLAFTKRYPKKVKQLVLLDGGYLFARNFGVSVEEEMEGAKQFIEGMKFQSIQEIVEAEKSKMKRWSPLLEQATLQRFKKTELDTYELKIESSTAATYTKIFYDFQLTSLPMPVTLIAAKQPHELETIRQKAIEALKEVLPQANVKRINTSHDLLAEDPKSVAELLNILI